MIKRTVDDGMRSYVGLDVSQATTAICVVDEDGRTLAEGKVPTCPRAIAAFVRAQAPGLIRIGLETGPLALWLFGVLRQDGLPVVCLDARHADAGLIMMANKTDRNDAAGIAQIVRTGWFRQVHVRSEASYVVRARLATRTALVRQRCEVDNQIRGQLKTFGILIGKAPGGLRKRAAEIAGDELANQPDSPSWSGCCSRCAPRCATRSPRSIASSPGRRDRFQSVAGS